MPRVIQYPMTNKIITQAMSCYSNISRQYIGDYIIYRKCIHTNNFTKFKKQYFIRRTLHIEQTFINNKRLRTQKKRLPFTKLGTRMNVFWRKTCYFFYAHIIFTPTIKTMEIYKPLTYTNTDTEEDNARWI